MENNMLTANSFFYLYFFFLLNPCSRKPIDLLINARLSRYVRFELKNIIGCERQQNKKVTLVW